MVRTQIQLTDEQAAKIKKIARSRRLSMAEVIRQAVDGALESALHTDLEDLRGRAVNVTGKYRSGRRDVSAEHDKYLAEALAK